jgi:hypothetical protein
MTSAADDAQAIVTEAIEWLRTHYADFRFYVERDLVWTLQTWIDRRLRESSSALRVYNDYPVLPGNRRSLSADLALVTPAREIALALEFKYEPDHAREDVLKSKLPVVFWGKEGVAKDVSRVREFVTCGRARAAWSYFVDEGRFFRHRPAHPGSEWVQWRDRTWVLACHA